MRNIIFRAKGRDGEGWQEGYYWKTSETTYCFKEDYEQNPNNTKHYLLFDRMTDWGLPNQKYRMDIAPETLCQFTGILDKNGKRIYEGDIIQRDIFGELVTGVVVWMDRGNTGFMLEIPFDGGKRYYSMGKGQFDDDMGDKCSDLIVGNIFDNPET